MVLAEVHKENPFQRIVDPLLLYEVKTQQEVIS